ncbi:BMC domain-containing protein [Clostridium merdae]|uniref:BMC domain-containing protein n=1 Tax=Clostridium merdae TaxID=1958780 RepID=UPI000A26CB2E|nr:BMC domain-containing protein [Clostridium merdae]
MNDALGLVEIKGLAAAIAVADAMVKTANVGLIGIEKAKGFGWITIKITGDVGAVTASVQTGRAVAEQNGQLVSFKVIPRPAKSIGEVFCKTTQEPPPEDPEPASSLPELPEPDSQSEPMVNTDEPESIAMQEIPESAVEEKAYLQQKLVIQNEATLEAALIEREQNQIPVDNQVIEPVMEVDALHSESEAKEELQIQAEEQKESATEQEAAKPAKKGRPAKSPGRPPKNKKKQGDSEIARPEEGSR